MDNTIARKKSVLIAVPTDTYIHHTVTGTLCQILQNNTKYEVDTLISSMKGIGEHRNVIVKEFLKGDYDFLLMIDSDNPPPPNVLDLIDFDKDIIGCPTPINMNWNGVNDIYWGVYLGGDKFDREGGEGLERVDKITTGCILIKREVLEEVEHPFTTVRDADDIRIIGTDIAFCNKCKELEFEIYAAWDFRCRHFKEINLLDLI